MDKLIAELIECNIEDIGKKAQDPDIHSSIENFFDGARVVTLYRDRDGNYKEFPFGGYTLSFM